MADVPDYAFLSTLLANAKAHFKLVYGLTATKPSIQYLDEFAFGKHHLRGDALSLTKEEEVHAFAMLEHTGTYLAAIQVHTVLEALHQPDPFMIADAAIADAFQIARLIRNAFAHNPFAPHWEVKGKWRRVYDVPRVIHLDATNLDGSNVRREHYGGPLAILVFLEFAIGIVERRRLERAT